MSDKKDIFEVNIDIEGLSLDDIKVKTVKGFVVIEGQRGEKQFYRHCRLPVGFNAEQLLSQITEDGELKITATLVKESNEDEKGDEQKTEEANNSADDEGENNAEDIEHEI